MESDDLNNPKCLKWFSDYGKNDVWTFAHDASELSRDVPLSYDRGAALRLSSAQVGAGDAALPLCAQQVALWRILCAAGFNGSLDDLVELLQRST